MHRIECTHCTVRAPVFGTLNSAISMQGRIQDFHLGGGGGGGGRKRLCASTHIRSEEPNSLSAGVQGPLKGAGSSRCMPVAPPPPPGSAASKSVTLNLHLSEL